jgi:dihydropteroate synthase
MEEVFMFINGKGRALDLSSPKVMGILNMTPDSFSDGGSYSTLDQALFRVERMVEEGAAIIDVGGESTRPGADYIPAELEIERVVPIIEKIAANIDVMISIDTYKTVVMQAACHAGAHLINDINALNDEGAMAYAAQSDAAVCIMHMQGNPATMQIAPNYQNVVQEVSDFLAAKINQLHQLGLQPNKLIIDPGFGFGKTVEQNYNLLANMDKIIGWGQYPFLVGVSRKSMIGAVTDKPVTERLAGSLGAAMFALTKNANILRVHDVAATVDAIKTFTFAAQFQ